MSKFLLNTNEIKQEAAVWGLQGSENDKFIGEACYIIQEIKDLIRNKKYKSITDPYAIDGFENLLKKFGKCLSNRFNVKIKVYNVSAENACVHNIMPVIENPLIYEKNKEYISSFKDLLKELKNNKDKKEDNKVAITYLNDIIKSSTEATNLIKNGILKIDLKNIKFLNAQDLTFYTEIGFSHFTHTRRVEEFTQREILAIILHEIGHAFEFIHGLNTEVINNNSIYEEIEYLSKQNKTPTEILNMVFKDKNGKIKNSPKEENAIMCIVKFSKELINRKRTQGYVKLYRMNKELEADRFAIAFNLGKDLASALKKLQSDRYSGGLLDLQTINKGFFFGKFRLLDYVNRTSVGRILTLYINFTLIFWMQMVKGVFATPMCIIANIIVYTTEIILTFLGLIGLEEEYMHYRSLKERLIYIRTETIKILKRTDRKKEKELHDRLVEEIKEIDEKIADTYVVEDSIPLVDIAIGAEICRFIISILSSNDKDTKEIVNLERRMEDLINNSLFHSTAALKTL